MSGFYGNDLCLKPSKKFGKLSKPVLSMDGSTGGPITENRQSKTRFTQISYCRFPKSS
jgi:hypothetical protein